MTEQQENSSILIDSLMAKVDFLERALATRDSAIVERNSVIAERNSVIAAKESVIAAKESAMSKLTADYNAEKNALNHPWIQINCLLNLSQRQLK